MEALWSSGSYLNTLETNLSLVKLNDTQIFSLWILEIVHKLKAIEIENPDFGKIFHKFSCAS